MRHPRFWRFLGSIAIIGLFTAILPKQIPSENCVASRDSEARLVLAASWLHDRHQGFKIPRKN